MLNGSYDILSAEEKTIGEIVGLWEPGATATLLLVFGMLVVASVLFTRTLDRIGVPVVLLFLGLGMLGGSEGIGGIVFEDYERAFRYGTIALVLILFDGGLNTSRSAIRRSIGPAGVLATVGVFATAGIVALVGRLFGLSWTESMLIGAIVSSTDAAAVFAVLRGGSLRVKEPARSTLEVESCVNDPMAVILTVAVVDLMVRGRSEASMMWMAVGVPLQLLIGTAVGFAVGYGFRWTLNRFPLSTAGLYPAATLASGFIAFGAGTIAHGSGFLAVFVTAAVLGNGPLPYKAGLVRVHDAIAWFAQVSMFLMLGLLVFPSQLAEVALAGLGIGLALAFLARPLSVFLCLLPFRFEFRHSAYCAWVGIRGAVPIVLATIPMMAGLQDGARIFNLVFFIVVLSAIVPGATIVSVTRRMGLKEPSSPAPAAMLEMHSMRRLDGEIRIYRIHRTVAVCGALLSEIAFPEGASALLIVRGQELIPARGRARLEEGDFVYVFCRAADEQSIGLLFGSSVQ